MVKRDCEWFKLNKKDEKIVKMVENKRKRVLTLENG